MVGCGIWPKLYGSFGPSGRDVMEKGHRTCGAGTPRRGSAFVGGVLSEMLFHGESLI